MRAAEREERAALLCALRWWWPPAGEFAAALRRLNFASRFYSGLSRAAHEVFGPIFDIGPILVDFEVLRFLGPKFLAQYDDAIKIVKYDFNCKI
ncbi:hypothetical protein F511_14703 [Dorcoceras hygrometricum]|uniref:Uncharacterized protein n=1 Tax=Dorcoceras hygrometricum TaxID=472368 RepID=A0A2Z7BJ87_9LAMI|nr:hypothetical protein F511_14703 [Dorcoceras hygrometricum]